jgi:hypothetical protein
VQPLGRISGTWVVVLIVALANAACATYKSGVFSKDKLLSSSRVSQIDTKTSQGPAATEARLQVTYAKLPLHFEPNQGQIDEEVHFSPGAVVTPCS